MLPSFTTLKWTYILLVCCLFSQIHSISQAPPTYLQVDQFGYLPNSSKVAVLHNPVNGFNASDQYTPGSTIEVRNAQSEAVVFSGSPIAWNGGATHDQSGDQGWWFDFSSVQQVGEYYLRDVTNGQKSAKFRIDEQVYSPILKASMRMFYYNRCNMAKESPYAEPNWRDGPSFNNDFQDYNTRYIYDVSNTDLEKDLSGGWFDAGDFNKYVTFADYAMHNLLWAYRENPEVFGDDWNIPESGNGIPDIIDEIIWELDWLMKMNNSDGSTHIKMGSRNYGENKDYPPSANTDPRYYGPTCTAASISVAGVFAHAAIVLKEFPSLSSYAEELENRAQASWNYVAPRLDNRSQLETACDDGSIVAGDADWDVLKQIEHAVIAAIYLYQITGEQSFNQYVQATARETEPLMVGFWGGYKLPLMDALMVYTQLPGREATLASTISNSFSQAARNNYNGFFGFNEADLFRAYMPDWAYHWGSNLAKAGFGVLNLLLNSYGLNSDAESDYELKALEQLHYFHGVNPLGMVQLSNMYGLGGEHCVNQIYHQWFAHGSPWDDALSSQYGPAPGFVTGGPNKDFTVTSLTPPSGQPPQKAYLDWNEIPTQSWEITEPAIYYQAIYVRLIAAFAAEGSVVDPPDPPVDSCAQATGSDLPLKRIDWSKAGYPGAFPSPSNEVDVVQAFGALPDGESDAGPAIQMALNSAGPGTVVYIPEGTYKIRNTLKIPEGVILRGACSESTALRFDLATNSGPCIEVLTYEYGEYVSVSGGMEKGSNRIQVASTSGFSIGSYADIEQENDPTIMYTQERWNQSWAQNAVGQIVKIMGIEGNELIVSPSLHTTFSTNLNPRIRPTGLIEEVGIENMGIMRENTGAGETILIKNAANCWVKNVSSDFTVSNHVLISQSLNIEVRDSYFRRSHDYGGGGRGYGVNCARHATDCLVENNIFQTLRHAMMVKEGASGNVFSYNYSIDPFWSDSDTNIPPDISLHGHYPSMNLFEGNIVQELTSSDFWGPSGPGNTFFRNRVEQSNLSIRDASHDQQVIANELTGGNTGISIDNSVDQTYIHGNNVNGTVVWNPSVGEGPLPASLYLCEKPSFFGNLPWPSIGPEFTLDCGTIPAKVRFLAGQMTLCRPFVPSLPDGEVCGGEPDPIAIQVNVRILLEGSFDAAQDKLSNILSTSGLLPTTQPFDGAPYNYMGQETLSSLQDTLADWVLVEVREAANPGNVLTRRAAILSTGGVLLSTDDLALLDFPDLAAGNYYIAFYHHSHLAVMSANPIEFSRQPALFDLSTATENASGNAQLKPLSNTKFGLFCGDYDGNGLINNLDFNAWNRSGAALNQYLPVDGDGNGVVNNLDFNLWKVNGSKVGIREIQK
ncbi:MAG: glycoside hydrolase family 9 protein [Bacteroidota bacterium]